MVRSVSGFPVTIILRSDERCDDEPLGGAAKLILVLLELDTTLLVDEVEAGDFSLCIESVPPLILLSSGGVTGRTISESQK